jgi:hypothetical protein
MLPFEQRIFYVWITRSLGLELCTRAAAEMWVIARGFVTANRYRTAWRSGIADATVIYNTATIA